MSLFSRTPLLGSVILLFFLPLLAGCLGTRELNTHGTEPLSQSVEEPGARDENPCAMIVPPVEIPTDVERDSLDVPPELIGGLGGLVGRLRYPETARRAGLEGGVCLQFVVDERGTVQNVEVVRSAHPLLDEEAIRAVRASVFKAGMKDGEPVKVLFSLPVRFRLQGELDLATELIVTAAVLGVAVLIGVLRGPPE